ncbi:MAG: helix-turn-helix domain-containing protein [Armatimonadota bacterium]
MTKNRLYHVTLTDDEYTSLRAFVKTQAAGRKNTRARILLLAHEREASDREIAEVLHTSSDTVQRTRRKFVEGGVEFALAEKRRPGSQVKFTPEQERQIAMLACSTPPEGCTRWTLQLLADKVVALGMVDTVSKEPIRHALKKGARSSPGTRTLGS